MYNTNQDCDLLDVLLDPENRDDIVLMATDGTPINFQQVAIIPIKDPYTKEVICFYTILKPVDEVANIADDEAMVFRVEPDESGNTVLRLETDEVKAISIYDKYRELLAKAVARKENKKHSN